MKRLSTLAMAFVLTAALFTGCGCRNSRPAYTDPTVLPTPERATTAATTAPTTHATEPNTHTTEPHTNATTEHGNGPLNTEATHAGTGATENGTENAGRSRHIPVG